MLVVYGLGAQLKELYANVTPPPPVRISSHFYGLNWIIQFWQVFSTLFFCSDGKYRVWVFYSLSVDPGSVYRRWKVFSQANKANHIYLIQNYYFAAHEVWWRANFLKLSFTPCTAKMPLRRMELQGKKKMKIIEEAV